MNPIARPLPFIRAGSPRPACRDVDPEKFYPSKHSATYREDAREARATCLACPLLDPCREWAITTREPFGIWGAMSPAQRAAERRRRALAEAVAA